MQLIQMFRHKFEPNDYVHVGRYLSYDVDYDKTRFVLDLPEHDDWEPLHDWEPIPKGCY